MAALGLAALAFVGSHLLLSHPLRRSFVARLGERGFSGLYSLIAFVTLGALIATYRAVGPQAPLWVTNDLLWAAASLAMWFASILLVGSFVRNPAFPGARGRREPSGVFNITRHPMMWSFALWAVVHLVVVATPKALILDGAILFLALAGSAGQDRKKARLAGSDWHEWAARTAFVPFARGLAWPGAFAVAVGTILFFAATWAHGAAGSMPAGPWRWIG